MSAPVASLMAAGRTPIALITHRLIPDAPFDIFADNRYNLPGIMKKDLHPNNYRPVVFQDLNNGTTYLTRSTVASDETIKLDGTEYPLVKIHISSSSHPFFTGEERILDIEGRVDKFKARAAAGQAAKDKRAAAAKKIAARKSAKAEKADAKKPSK
jgi:large subunit ribosomal protein L31